MNGFGAKEKSRIEGKKGARMRVTWNATRSKRVRMEKTRLSAMAGTATAAVEEERYCGKRM